jgi:hypothetical protein
MARTVQRLLRVALLGAILASLPDPARAQAPSPGSRGAARTTAQFSYTKPSPSDDGFEDDSADSPPELLLLQDSAIAGPRPDQPQDEKEPDFFKEPEFLKTLPRPPDQPHSLFQPAPPLGPPTFDLEQPYFQLDPILDPPQWPQVGWFCDVQVAGVRPYVQNEMSETVVTGLGRPIFVALSAARLNWTAAPRFELGYRLPSGFGEFSVSDTGFTANGGESFLGPDGPAMRTSALQLNYTDLDYLSREYTPWANCDMKWRAGMRVAESFTTTTFSQSFAQAAAGSGLLTAQQSNATFGFGPHFAVELEHRLAQPGFSLVGKIDVADNYTHIRQRYSAVTTTVTPSGLDSGVIIDKFLNQVVMLSVQAGLAWRPPSYPNSRLFLGYVDETWFNPLANDNTYTTLGQFYYQGVVLRASWNY